MTERNLFDEVKEDLERQRMEALWKQYGLWVALFAFAVVLATAGSSFYRSWKLDHSQHTTSALLAASKLETDTTKTLDALQKFAETNPGTDEATLAQLHAGALAVDHNDTSKAIEIFDSVANNAKADPAFRQLGDLLSVQLQMDSGDAAVLSVRLDPLTAEHAPWRFSAMETQAYLELRKGDKAKAKQIFTDLSQEASVPQTIAVRASDMLHSLD